MRSMQFVLVSKAHVQCELTLFLAIKHAANAVDYEDIEETIEDESANVRIEPSKVDSYYTKALSTLRPTNGVHPPKKSVEEDYDDEGTDAPKETTVAIVPIASAVVKVFTYTFLVC